MRLSNHTAFWELANSILICNMLYNQRICYGFFYRFYLPPCNLVYACGRIQRTFWRRFPYQPIFSSPSILMPEGNETRVPGTLQRTNATLSLQTTKVDLGSLMTISSRKFSAVGVVDNNSFVVPKKISIPLDQVQLSFSRSSGAGGQNVNKVETKAEIRFHVMSAMWLPLEVRQRLYNNEANRINSEGYFALSSQEYRTQHQNRKAVISKLEEICLKAYPRPKVRKIRQGLSKKTKEQRREDKRLRSQTKESRKRVDF
jgi:hypothetical protein